MKQSRRMSLLESIANIVVGYGVAVVTRCWCFRCLECKPDSPIT